MQVHIVPGCGPNTLRSLNDSSSSPSISSFMSLAEKGLFISSLPTLFRLGLEQENLPVFVPV